MEKMRVLVANDPYVYRETITCVLRELRPHIEIKAVEPDDLDGAVSRLRPHLVVCSRLTTAVQILLAWVVLYPEAENRAVIGTAGEETTVTDMRFGDLLSAIDRTELILLEPAS